MVGTLSGQVNTGEISSLFVNQLSSILEIDAKDIANGELDGVSESIIGEVFNSLSGVLPEGLDLTSLIPSIANQTKERVLLLDWM